MFLVILVHLQEDYQKEWVGDKKLILLKILNPLLRGFFVF
jgi:hypothetical protein